MMKYDITTYLFDDIMIDRLNCTTANYNYSLSNLGLQFWGTTKYNSDLLNDQTFFFSSGCLKFGWSKFYCTEVVKFVLIVSSNSQINYLSEKNYRIIF